VQRVENSIASMGPRSVERGKKVNAVRAFGVLELQWGRVLLNAESKRDSQERCERMTKHPAAGLRRAESKRDSQERCERMTKHPAAGLRRAESKRDSQERCECR